MPSPLPPSPPTPAARAPRPKSRLGRALVGALFLVAAVWGVLSTMGSVAADLYAAPPNNLATAVSFRDRSWCARRLAALQEELDARVTFEIGAAPPDGDPVGRWDAFVSAWGVSLRDAESRCRPLGPETSAAYARLDALRTELDGGTRQILRARALRGTEIRREAQSLLPGEIPLPAASDVR